MKKKQQPQRKRNRFVKKILIFSLGCIGIVIGIIAGIMGVMYYKTQQPLYLSPLASVAFTKQHQEPIGKLKKGLEDAEISFTDIKPGEDSTFIVTLQRGSEVIFSSTKDLQRQIASLQYILSHLTMEDRQFKRLDLRYDKPIIVLK